MHNALLMQKKITCPNSQMSRKDGYTVYFLMLDYLIIQGYFWGNNFYYYEIIISYIYSLELYFTL